MLLPPSSDFDLIAIPAVTSVGLAPTVIDPINGIGKRASVVVTIKDFTHSDLGLDPYVAERGYDSTKRSTFWLKLLTRNPYYQNRPLRVKVGYIVDGEAPDPANFQTRLYLMQRIDGPDATGSIRITAQDPLKLLDNERSKSPLANTGTLLADITFADMSATLTPAGIGDAEYAASGTMAMGSELATFTRVADAITFVARGTNGTAEDHNAGSAMQVCTVYSGQSITEVLYDLLVNKAGISADYIDLAAWNAEADVWLSEYEIATTIAKPVGVNQLVGELAQQCLFYIWWDERTQLITFRAIRPTGHDAVSTIDDTNNIIADTQARTEKPEDRKTQVWVYHGQLDPLVDLAKPYNFLSVRATADADAEGDPEYGDSRILPIYSRWLPITATSEADKLGLRLLNRYRDNPKTYQFKLDAKDSAIWTGDVVSATMRSIIDFTGAQVATPLQILEVRETVPGSEYEYVAQDTQFKGRYAFWAPDDEDDYLDATDADRARYAWWSDGSGLMSDNSSGYQYV